MRYLLTFVILLLALPFVLQAGFGFYYGLDVKNGLRTFALGLVRQDLVFTVKEFHPESLPEFKPRRVIWKGELDNEALSEASGLAASGRRGGTLFSINDSGNEPRLFAIGNAGKDVGSWPLAYRETHDFEDMASFSYKGENYLLVADTGDNFNWRPRLTLLVFAEPQSSEQYPFAESAALNPAWSFQYSYPEGYRDCEAVAVDERDDRIYLISKRRVPAEVFSLPLRPEAEHVVARFEGRLDLLPQPSQRDLREDPWYGLYRSTPTALDIHDRTAVVITYRDAYLYKRKRSASWPETFAGKPERVALPHIYGLESGAISSDGDRLLLVGEREDGVGRMGVYEVEL